MILVHGHRGARARFPKTLSPLPLRYLRRRPTPWNWISPLPKMSNSSSHMTPLINATICEGPHTGVPSTPSHWPN